MYRLKILITGIALLCLAVPLQAYKPIDTTTSPGVQKSLPAGSVDPLSRGLKNLRRLTIGDLFDSSQDLLARQLRIKTPASAGVEVPNRINKWLRSRHSTVRVTRIEKDRLGILHVRLSQFHRGIPVIGSDMIVHINKDNEIFALSGNLAPAMDVDSVATMKADDAQLIARKSITNGQRATRDSSKLVIFDGTLAYEILVQGHDNGPELYKCYVDAKSGTLLSKLNQIITSGPSSNGTHVPVSGVKLAGEGGTTVTMNGWHDAGGNYFFYNKDSLWRVFNLQTNDFEQRTTSSWGSSDPAAVSLAKNFSIIQNYVSQVDGINSFDNAGGYAQANVHEGTSYVNAYWDGSDFHFGDGDGSEANALTVLDVAGHEYGHAITQYTSNLNYSYESGALNESYSDIHGTLIEFWAQPDGRSSYPNKTIGAADWLCGEDCWLSGVALRDLRNPQRYNQPSYYMGTYWYSGSGDNGGVHYNSGVQNFAFYLLSEGGSGSNDGHAYNITGIGIQHAGEIAMYADMHLLTSTSQYRDARDAWVLAASVLGYNATTVSNVWTACGVMPLVKHISASPSTLAYGVVGVGTSDTLVVTLSNNGASSAIVNSLSFSDPWFTAASPTTFTVPGGGMYSLKVVCTPTQYATRSATLTISSNADDNPSITIGLSATGASPAALSVSPASISVNLLAGDSSTSMLKIKNTGSANLRFTAAAIDKSSASVAAMQPYDASYYLPLAKGAVDTRVGRPVESLRGGADSAGYRWMDSDESGGPVFTWDDIVSTGTLLSSVSGCDDCYESHALSFPFPFYGNSFTSIYVSSNGYVTLGTPNSSYSNTALPSSSAPLNMIAGFWDDLYPGQGSGIYFKDYGDHAVIQFNNVALLSGSGTVTFQIVLNSDGTIRMYYKTMTGTLTSATAGIQNQTGTIGLTAAYNTTYFKNNLALMFSKRPMWLTVGATSGTVPPGDSILLPVKCNSASITPNYYYGIVQLTHNALNLPSPVAVPCTMHVAGVKRLSVTPSTLNFGPVWAGARDTLLLTLRNVGTEGTIVSSLSSSNPDFTPVASLPFLVPANGSASVKVILTSSILGPTSGMLSIASNADDNSSLSVACSGTITSAPTAQVSPSSLTFSLYPTTPGSQVSTLSNIGGDTLRYSVSCTEVSRPPQGRAGITWLSVAPTSGNLSPGSLQNLAITVNPAGCAAGQWVGNVRITSNDPVNPQITVTVTATIAGCKNLSIDKTNLDFGTIWAGNNKQVPISLTNSCNDSVTILSMSFTNSAFSTNAACPLKVPPFGAVSISVGFSPADSGNYTGNLTIQSDAEDNPNIALAMNGRGILPPLISMTPGSFHPTVQSGDSVTQYLTIKNTVGAGNANLIFTIQAQSQTSIVSSSNPELILADTTGRAPTLSILDGSGKASNPLNPSSLGISRFSASGLKILYLQTMINTDATDNFVAGLRSLSSVAQLKVLSGTSSTPNLAYLQGYDIVVVASNSPWSDPTTTGNVLADYVDAGGKVCLLQGTTCSGGSWALGGRIVTSNYSPFAVTNYSYSDSAVCRTFQNHPITRGVSSISTKLYAYISSLQGNAISLGTYSNSYQMAAYRPDKPIVAFNTFVEDGYWGGDLILMIGNAFDYLSGSSWLKVSSTSDTLAPGDSSIIAVNFSSSNLLAGNYTDVLKIAHNASNASAIVSVPCTLSVNSLRKIAVSPSSLNFGTRWIGSSTPLTVTFSNSGNDTTRITSISCGSAVFSLATTLPIKIPPFGTTTATIRFSPVANTVSNDSIVILSDAGDNPHLSVMVTGSGIVPPVMSVSPSSFHEILNPSTSVLRQILINNPGQDTLRFQASPTVSWLSTGIQSGIVPPGSSSSIPLTISSSSMLSGTYYGSVSLTHNDPNQASPIALPCTLGVNAIRRCSATPMTLSFGTVRIGSQLTKTITLSNSGNAATTISAIDGADGNFSHTATLPLTVPAFGSTTFSVIFRPITSGQVSGTLTLQGNAQDNPISISLSGNGLQPPHIALNPSSVNETASQGAILTKTLSVFNTGEDSLHFTAAVVDQSSTVKPASALYDESHFITLDHGQKDSRIGLPVATASGGPDAFGYRWTDSDQSGGPTYVWNDISTSGTVISGVTGCGDCYAPVSFSMPFNFYGTTYKSCWITTKGLISFVSGTYAYTNYPLPSTSAPSGIICAFWDDLSTAANGQIYMKEDANSVTFQWNNIHVYGGSGNQYTFQMVLGIDGSISFYYKTMTGTVTSATVGIQNQTATTGLTIAYNTSYIKNNFAVRISKRPVWLSIGTQSGSIASGGSLPIALTLNTTGISAGSYSGIVRFTHDDPSQSSPLDIPVSLLVSSPGALKCMQLRVGPSVSSSVQGSSYRLRNFSIGDATAGTMRGNLYILKMVP